MAGDILLTVTIGSATLVGASAVFILTNKWWAGLLILITGLIFYLIGWKYQLKIARIEAGWSR